MTRWKLSANYKQRHTPVMIGELQRLKNDPAAFAADYCWSDHPTLGVRRYPPFPI